MVRSGNKTLLPFDPEPSLKLALDILSAAGVKRFALIGRLAVWAHIEDESQHRFTKDVDFGVLVADSGSIEKEIKRRRLSAQKLKIGGIGVRDNGCNVDFVSRELHGVDQLFAEAIEAADRSVTVGEQSIPVVSLEYLIAMKMASGEPKDDADVKLLLTQSPNYQLARAITEKFFSPFTANRLDVFARESGLLPPRGPYEES